MRSGVYSSALVVAALWLSAYSFNLKLEDVTCSAVELNDANKGLNDVLSRLTSRSNFFSIFKVDLMKECPFWPDDGMCTSKDSCGVECCGDDEIPVSWRADGEEGCVECKDDPKLDTRVNDEGLFSFRVTDDDVWTIQDCEKKMIYVDLRTNPESYTGYRGDSARKAWTAIYEENCFNFAKNCQGGICDSESCKEERVLFKLISGIHTSITMSIVKEFVAKEDGSLDLDMYLKRVGYFEDRKGNLYFLLALLTRAVAKSVDTLAKFEYSTGDSTNDADTEMILQELWNHPSIKPGCLKTFDETDMFQGLPDLKDEFRRHFRNISSIMDCVGCEKCKLWGKLEFLGLGTALKLLFDSSPQLQRNEIIALFQTLKKTSDSVGLVEKFEHAVLEEKAAEAKRAEDARRREAVKEALLIANKYALPVLASVLVALLTTIGALLLRRQPSGTKKPASTTPKANGSIRRRTE
uniref:Endoplasmic reticulum oxidoreductin 1 n=1 Tax=Rhodosorus marinus TaxID=101924 RepID=A0A7S3A186_9RHOD|mmetsp:Transcript_40907/g.162006  ORF Transcript_40907/g.162006 Transcript_40907/m.162006 type:complete len:466 (+) Transcript_40907:291-1688(+)|eukprot:CAMPEP_0113962446 /NCGR_PEP_ID=MMETSP0011_2-20120614/5922_1 /TAXON_ID=101924 /ORGANISM="Rhodosorus marinus" /LENGTH=465 /DNA_ID=CAMNT_0000974305 /DNA_START=205 /DNA_END=1602 /DNA_ORIENTATION=- /assembly_acc=CAM_ASM_000156